MSEETTSKEIREDKLPPWQAELHSAMELLEQGKIVNSLTALHAMLQDYGKDEFCRALVFDGMGRALFMDGKPDLGLEAFTESLTILRRLYNEQKVSAAALLGAIQNLAHAQMMAGNLDASLKSAREGVELAEKAWPQGSSEIARAYFTLAATLYEMKDFDGAETALLKAKKILEGLPGQPDEQIGTILNNLGRIYEERGDLTNGIDYHRRAVEFRRKLENKEDLAFSLGNYGVALGTAGKLREACEALLESIVIYAALNQAETPVAQAFAKNLELFQNIRNKTSEDGNG